MLTVDYDRLGVESGDTLLDLGCGFGRHAFAAARRGAAVVALDAGPDEVAGVRDTFGAMVDAGELDSATARAGAVQGDALHLPFPDGTIIAALHYTHSPNAENDKIFGQPQSFTPGTPTNIQFMIKDSKKYAATGGWGFGTFTPDGKPAAPAAMKSCYPCHLRDTAHDLVFTQYAP